MIGVMHDGRIEQLDTPEAIYRRPATAFVSEFVGVTNRIPVVLDGNRIRVFGRYLGIDNLAAAGSNGTSLEALIRPADQALRIGMPAHDAMSFTVGHRMVIIPRGDINLTLAGNSNAALQEEDAA